MMNKKKEFQEQRPNISLEWLLLSLAARPNMERTALTNHALLLDGRRPVLRA